MRTLPGLVLGLALLAAGCSSSSSHHAPPSDAAHKGAPAAEQVKDPVCGMMVDPKTAEKAEYKGKTYYFCAREEREAFEKNPAKYVTDSGA